jgi:hypothetical protein
MVAFVSYAYKKPIHEIRRWTLKTIIENFEYQMFIRKEMKDVSEEMME